MDVQRVIGRFKKEPSMLDEQIFDVEEKICLADPLSGEFQMLVKSHEDLTRIRDAGKKRGCGIDPNVMAQIGCTLLCTVMILTFDKFSENIITTKAFSWIPRPKVY